MLKVAIITFVAAAALGAVILVSLTLIELISIIKDKLHHAKIRKKNYEDFEKNRPFASEELIREADKIMNDDNESDNARDFAKRVYIIGRTAQAAQEEKNDR